jgi:hypothetical protein
MHNPNAVLPYILGKAQSMPQSLGTVEGANPKFRPGNLERFQLLQQLARISQAPQMQIESRRIDSEGQVRNLPFGPANVEVGDQLQ